MAGPYDSLNLFDLTISKKAEPSGEAPVPNQQKENEQPTPIVKPSSVPWRSARVQSKQKENESRRPLSKDVGDSNQTVPTAPPARPEPWTLVPGQYSGPLRTGPPPLTGPELIVRDYLRANDHIFRALDDLREKGWKSTAGDTHFRNLQAASDNADPEERERFYEMFKAVGLEMHIATDLFNVNAPLTTTPTATQTLTTISRHPHALNLCMAPGGYTWAFLHHHPTAHVCGITLPENMGGHPMLLPHGFNDPRIEVQFLDLTMLATEYGVPLSTIPPTHPEVSKFSAARPFSDTPHGFSLVLCDGQVLRTHARADCRRDLEAIRLTTAQLILGMQRLREGGTFAILLHKVDAYDSILLLRAFDSFSRIVLFKPVRKFRVRSSFYLVAKEVRVGCEEAKS
ncbi:MAG: hypothetical protein M1835_001132, partial [Candelina submexicana]